MGQHGQVVLLAHMILSCHEPNLLLTDIPLNFVLQVGWIYHIFLLNSVGELVYWEFIDIGHHITRDKVSIHSQMSGK
jgi:hypothetical protein